MSVTQGPEVYQLTRHRLLLQLFLTFALLTSINRPAAAQQTNRIAELVLGLGAETHKERSDAIHALWQIGSPARDALERATHSDDPESPQRPTSFCKTSVTVFALRGRTCSNKRRATIRGSPQRSRWHSRTDSYKPSTKAPFPFC